MIELAAAWVRRDPAGKSLLAAYEEAEPETAMPDVIPRQSHSPDETPDGVSSNADSNGGWVARLRDVEGVSPDELSRIHGKLIAFGFLEFDLTGRSTGVRYRVSRQGRAVLRGDFERWCADEADESRDECRETASVADGG